RASDGVIGYPGHSPEGFQEVDLQSLFERLLVITHGKPFLPVQFHDGGEFRDFQSRLFRLSFRLVVLLRLPTSRLKRITIIKVRVLTPCGIKYLFIDASISLQNGIASQGGKRHKDYKSQ